MRLSCFLFVASKEVIAMSITVTGRKMPVTDALRQYAEEKIGNSMKVMDIDPLVAEIVLFVEKNPANPRPACCEVTLRTKGHIIRVEECEEDMYAAIDVAAAKVVRQLRKYKTKVIDRKLRAADESVRAAEPTAAGELDVEGLMEELRRVAVNALESCQQEHCTDWAAIKAEMKNDLSNFLYKKTKRNPMILPVIMEV